jgi:hypothetical protein
MIQIGLDVQPPKNPCALREVARRSEQVAIGLDSHRLLVAFDVRTILYQKIVNIIREDGSVKIWERAAILRGFYAPDGASGPEIFPLVEIVDGFRLLERQYRNRACDI